MKNVTSHRVISEAGQVLPLAALMMVALIAIVGLAIDVSQAFTEQRWQRSVTDAAALAGGQDLQRPGRLLPDAAARVNARRTAMTVVASQLGATSIPDPATDPNCTLAVGCVVPGTPYRASVYAGVEGVLPRPTCLDCVPERAVQVNLSQPSFGLTFSRILGFSSWNVKASSVAGVVFARQYGVVTLRPTGPRLDPDPNADDLVVTGGSKVVVGDGDVVTNTNVVCSGFSSGSEVRLDTAKGFDIYHFDPYVAWTGGSGQCLNPPAGIQVTSPVADPGYAIPQRTASTPVFNSEAEALDPDNANCVRQQRLLSSAYLELATNLPINDPTKVTAKCVREGIYNFTLDVKDNSSGPPVAYLLEPGVYFFDAGLNVQSSLVGGYEPSNPGVALVFLEAKTQNGRPPGTFTTTNNDSLVALNVASTYCPLGGCPAGSWATAAIGPQGLVQTPNPNGTLLTLLVEPDRVKCLPVTDEEPTACKTSKGDRQTLNLHGGGSIFLAGVQYAPTDNVVLTGNSGQQADVGAMWSWTVSFNGGTQFNIRTANPELLGVLRLDRGCSPGNTCN